MSPIANMLTQIMNAQSRGYEEIVLPFSKTKLAVAEILKNKNMISEAEKKKKTTKKSELPVLNLRLKYDKGVGAITEIKLVSKPSRRVYAGKQDLKPVRNGYGFSVVSTSRGLMAGDDARKAGLGGEVLFEIW